MQQDEMDDPTMGACISCKRLGEEFPVHHTSCECELETCHKVICDDCRFTQGNWAWIDKGDDETQEVHADCYLRMVEAGLA